jgi:heptosyltransferase II
MFYYLLTRLVAPLLRWHISFGQWRRLKGGVPRGPRRVLLIQTAKIGDLVCTTPVIASLKASWPDCHLTVMVNPLGAPLLVNDPAIDQLWPVPASDWRGLAGKWRLLARLRAARFDDCICLSPNTTFLLVPLWAGVIRRGALLSNFPAATQERCRRFLTHSERHRGDRALIDSEFALLGQFGCERLDPARHLVRSAAGDLAAERFLALGHGPYIGVGVAAGNVMKAMSGEQLAGLCNQLLARLPHTLILVGAQSEQSIAAELRTRVTAPERLLDACGALALADLPSLVAHCAAYVGVDSGVTYIADAVGVPVVDIMGPANADDQRPVGAGSIVLRSALPCAPCSHAFRAPYTCWRGDRACIAGQNLEHVATLVVEAVTRHPLSR